MRTLFAACTIVTAVVLLASTAAAEGRGGAGLGKALAAAGGKGAGSAGLGRASQSLSRSSGRSRAGGMGQASGLGRAPLGRSGTIGLHDRQLAIEERNRDHRLFQADRLRQISDASGDAELAANADRMEAFAHDHYQRRVEHWEAFPQVGPQLGPAHGHVESQAAPPGLDIEIPLPEQAQQRPGWFRGWWNR